MLVSVKYYLRVRNSNQTTANAWVEEVFIDQDDENQEPLKHARVLIRKFNQTLRPGEERRTVIGATTHKPKPLGGRQSEGLTKYDKVK